MKTNIAIQRQSIRNINHIQTRTIRNINHIQTRTTEQVSRPAQSSVNRQSNRQLNISPELQRKVFELHQQIRQELGDVKYALLGKGMAAVLMGVENDDLNTLCPDMIAVPDTSILPYRNMGMLR